MTKYNIEDLLKDESYLDINYTEFEYLKKYIKTDDDKLIKLLRYKNILKEINKTVNLTRIEDDKMFLDKHFIDSFYLNEYIKENENVLDIGTGAGMPGLVLAILNENTNFVLVDSVSKKIEFINLVIKKLGIKNVVTISERFELINKKYLEYFDIGLCRGVAHLSIICEYIVPFLKVNGKFYPQKLNLSEVKEIENTKKILNLKIEKENEFILPNGDKRYIIEIRKYKKTDKKYPRNNGMAKKNPLM